MYYSLQEDKSYFSYKSTTVLNLKKKQTIISGVHICKYKYFEKSIKLPFSSSSPDAPAPSWAGGGAEAIAPAPWWAGGWLVWVGALCEGALGDLEGDLFLSIAILFIWKSKSNYQYVCACMELYVCINISSLQTASISETLTLFYIYIMH